MQKSRFPAPSAGKMKPIKISHPGSLTEMAHRAGESLVQYAEKHRHDTKDPIAERRSDLYLNVFRPADRARSDKKK